MMRLAGCVMLPMWVRATVDQDGTTRSLLLYAASLEINHAHDHCAVRVEGQTLEPASAIERAHRIVERVCDDAEAADVSGGSERRAQRKQKERTGVAFP
jgi:hypothetical protein